MSNLETPLDNHNKTTPNSPAGISPDEVGRISIIIPVADDETLWRDLFERLKNFSSGEVIFASAIPPPEGWQDGSNMKWLVCDKSGRAAQMNNAAAVAGGRFLWFVHADTRLPIAAEEKLLSAIADSPLSLHYFDLHFFDGGLRMRINAFGVRLRCAFFQNPFGDQALCIAKEVFHKAGGFPEDAPYGEDHLFVLHAACLGALPRRVGVAVGTSARRYQAHGWWRTVFLYQRLWFRQWRAFREDGAKK